MKRYGVLLPQLWCPDGQLLLENKLIRHYFSSHFQGNQNANDSAILKMFPMNFSNSSISKLIIHMKKLLGSDWLR